MFAATGSYGHACQSQWEQPDLLECDAHSIAVTWRLGSLARCVERVVWSLGLGLVLLELL